MVKKAEISRRTCATRGAAPPGLVLLGAVPMPFGCQLHVHAALAKPLAPAIVVVDLDPGCLDGGRDLPAHLLGFLGHGGGRLWIGSARAAAGRLMALGGPAAPPLTGAGCPPGALKTLPAALSDTTLTRPANPWLGGCPCRCQRVARNGSRERWQGGGALKKASCATADVQDAQSIGEVRVRERRGAGPDRWSNVDGTGWFPNR